MAEGESDVSVVELRVLDGPNLYFTRPAIKLTLEVGRWSRLSEARMVALADRAGLSPSPSARSPVRPGGPRTEQRLRFVARLASHLTRELAAASGVRVAVRARTGPEPEQVVVAFPWRRRTKAEALAREVASLMHALASSRATFASLVTRGAGRVAAAEEGPAPTVPDPRIPVIAVTGTNGKTTTVRLLAHLLMSAGRSVAWSSTDGVYFDGKLVEEGDYSGFGGAATAIAQPGVDVAVLETARGGILLRGIGTLHNDVAVVTNISSDHLGMHGIRTLDQLAEVKSTITRITRADGWDVLNADDPRVLAMRRGIRGRPWVFSTDPDHPAIRTTLEEHGRAITVIDGMLVLLRDGGSRPLVALRDVPVTLAGISTPYTQNAMGAAAAALGIGLSVEEVARGLRSFVMDQERNPGRANLFEADGRIVVVDYAHNEAGVAGLIEIANGLRRPGATVWLTYTTAGDRTDEVMHGVGYLAARGADRVAIALLERYLRGREPSVFIETLRAGAVDGGRDPADVPDFPDELTALKWMQAESSPGDVLALCALSQRREIFAHLEGTGATSVTATRLKELARRASRQGRRDGTTPG